MKIDLVVFFVEEESMKAFLENFLSRLGISTTAYKISVFEGKNQLKKNLTPKMNQWRLPNTQFFVLMDNDNKPNCKDVKLALFKQCEEANRPDTIIRLVCQELEAWYLGDLTTVSNYYNQPIKLSTLKQITQQNIKPDSVEKPSELLKQQFLKFQKGDLARHMGKHITLEDNSSVSFRYFVQALKTVFPCLPTTLETI
jgi:hypothetical protein